MLIEDRNENDIAADYLKLRAINDQLRERGKAWLWESLQIQVEQVNAQFAAQGSTDVLQIGKQEWQFTVASEAGQVTLVGERFGLRYRGQTLTLEIGWPREPQHGFIAALAGQRGLVRGRVSFSPNVTIDPLVKAELILLLANNELLWHEFKHKTKGELVTEARLRSYVDWVLKL